MESKGAAPSRRLSFLGEIDAVRALRGARRAAILWGVFLLALTSWPSPPEVPGISSLPHFDKAIHTFLYGVEGFLLYYSVAWPPESRSAWLRALAIAGVLAIWGTVDEIHQHWIPGRSMEASDALADTVGGSLGAVIASAWPRRKSLPSGFAPADRAEGRVRGR
jgi:VanZ family protein